MKPMVWCKGALNIAVLVGILFIPAGLRASENQCHGAQYGIEINCQCLENGLLDGNASLDQGAIIVGNSHLQRCAKCEERKKEERAKLANTILASVAQFFQGMITLATSGEETDDKVKAEQCVLMAQAVGNLIYQAHEHHRCRGIELDNTKGAFSLEKKDALIEVLYKYMHYAMIDEHVLTA